MIELKNVSKKFPLSKKQRVEQGTKEAFFHAVRNLDLEAHPGRVLTILGPNGAGKTTLLRMIATMMAPDEGEIHIDGNDSQRAATEVRQNLGFLTGATCLYDRLTTEETLKYFADLHKMSREDYEKRRDELVESLNLEDFLHRKVGKLSTGMKQRVSIARTVIHDPQVVIFDEPTSGLDIVASRSIIALIQECREAGKTVLFSTHRMDEVNLLSDDLAVIHKGRVLLQEPFEKFKERHPGRSLEEVFIQMLEDADS